MSTLSGAASLQAVGDSLLAGPSPGFLVRLGLDVLCAGVLVRGIYFHHYRRADFFLTLFSFNLSIFLITYLLNGVELTIGAAFGLFAVFSMLRYRTDAISAKDMTYLFLVIALGLIMSVAQVGWVGLLVIGGMLLATTALLESSILARREQAQAVHYENIRLIAPSRRAELIADLKTRTGVEVHRVDINEIDLLRDSARLTVYYYDS
jgi:hypothetical protein